MDTLLVILACALLGGLWLPVWALVTLRVQQVTGGPR